MTTKLEKVLEHLVNQEQDKAGELLHEHFIDIARSIYAPLSESDDIDESADEDIDESIEVDENADEENIEESRHDRFRDPDMMDIDPELDIDGEMGLDPDWNLDTIDWNDLEEDLDISDESGDLEQDLRGNRFGDDIDNMNSEIDFEEHFTEDIEHLFDDEHFGVDDAEEDLESEMSTDMGDEMGDLEGGDPEMGDPELGGEEFGGGFSDMSGDADEVVDASVDMTDVEDSLANVENALDELRAMFAQFNDAEDDPELAGTSDDFAGPEGDVGPEEDPDMSTEPAPEEDDGEGESDDEEPEDDEEDMTESAELKKITAKVMGDQGANTQSMLSKPPRSMRDLMNVVSYPDTDTGSEKGTQPQTPKDLGVSGPQDHGAKLKNEKEPSNKEEKVQGNSPIGSKGSKIGKGNL